MHPFGTLARLKRGEINLILLVAFLAVLAVPNGAYAASIPPQDCQAVLLFLQHDASLSLAGPGLAEGQGASLESGAQSGGKAGRKPETAYAPVSLRGLCLTLASPRGEAAIPSPVLLPSPVRPFGLLEWHQAIALSGISSGSSLE